jgi:hypothetical protein
MDARATCRPGPFCLRECRQVSVCDLSGVDRFVVWAIRWRSTPHEGDPSADACLDDSFERAGLRWAQPAFEQFIDAALDAPLPGGASERLGCWRLNPLEAHALHAIACLQSGLLGEAWKALAKVCARKQVPRALQSLQDLADALEQVGARIERWTFDDAMPVAG